MLTSEAMATFTREEAAAAMNGRWTGASGTVPLARFAIDSRAVGGNDLFFALSGPNHDGHDFLGDAFSRGAAAAVVSRSGIEAPEGRALLQVADTTLALQSLAARARRRRPLTVAGITGSSGKTTTKELAAAALGPRFRVHRSPGNLNNAYGLPLALLRMPDEVTAAVLEMGMSTPGEIARLAEIADPDVGAVLNVGEAHRMNFDSVDAIADAKGELFAGLRRDATAVFNAADGRVAARAARFPGRRISFGVECAADVAVSGVIDDIVEGVRFRVRTRTGGLPGIREFPLALRMYGRHNAGNAAAALAIALACGIEPESAAPLLAALPPLAGRGTVERLGSGVVLADETYNSNPTAMRSVLDSLAATRWTGRRVVVCGDMLELGDGARAAHRATGEAIARCGAGLLVAVGPLADETVAGYRSLGVEDAAGNSMAFPDSRAAAAAAGSFLRSGDLLLVKGSRGIGTEAVASAARALFPAESA